MRKALTVATVLASCLLAAVSASAQTDEVLRSHFALGMVFRLERLRESAADEIASAERLIRQSERTIAESAALASAARARGDDKSAAAAESAAATARAARDAAASNRESSIKLREQIELAIKAAKDNLARELAAGERREVSLLSRIVGSVFVSRSGNEMPFSGDPLIKTGDVIRTGPDGRAKLAILDGRGILDVSGSSRVRFEATGERTETIELESGAIRVTAEPEGSFQRSLESVLDRYKQDVQTIRDWFKELVVTKVRKPFVKKLNVRTPSIVLADRGTTFTVRETGGQTEIAVSEGAVEVEHRINGKRITIEAGFRVLANASGFSEISKIK